MSAALWMAPEALLAQTPPSATAPATNAVSLRTWEGRYYVIHADLPPAQAKEAQLRLDKLAEEFARRTKSFGGKIDQKLPFYLFSRERDYLAAGGMPGTAGSFNAKTEKLLAFAGEQLTDATWHTVQHEAFHQYTHVLIGKSLPMWLNEGLADYFGEAVFTGDGFITGVIPEWRRQRVQRTMSAGQFRSLPQFMRLSQDDWNASLSLVNYDQAWSLVQFLAHGDGERHRRGFARFVQDVAHGQAWQDAWKSHLEPLEQIERRWRNHWRRMPAHPSAHLHHRATVQILNSFLMRAAAQDQQFATVDAFLTSAARGDLKIARSDWLPPSLLQGALHDAQTMGAAGGTFHLESGKDGSPQIIYRTPAGGVVSSRDPDLGNMTPAQERSPK